LQNLQFQHRQRTLASFARPDPIFTLDFPGEGADGEGFRDSYVNLHVEVFGVEPVII
jgi:hypothetical protein